MNNRMVLLAVTCLVLGTAIGIFAFQQPATESIAPFCAKEGEVVFACAMHPQVQQARRGQCPLCGMHLTTQLAKTYINKALLQLEKNQAELAGIQTAVVQSGQEGVLEIPLSGKIQADRSRSYRQVAHLPGRIERLYVNEPGVFVKKGQRIATVYSKELIAVAEAFEYSKNSSSVVRSAENNLLNWKITEEQIASFDIKGGNYRKAVDVYSDFSGVVTELLVREGDLAVNTHMGAPTVYYEVVDLSRVWATFEVPEQWSGRIAVGDRVRFEVQAFPGESWEGNVAVLDPMVDPQKRTLGIRLEVPNPGLRLKPEMLAEGKIFIRPDIAPETVSIPETAVLWAGKKAVVYVVSDTYDGGVFEYREVVLGPYRQGGYDIKEGLQAGEQIVVAGAVRVDAAAQIQGKYSLFSTRLTDDPKEAEMAKPVLSQVQEGIIPVQED